MNSEQCIALSCPSPNAARPHFWPRILSFKRLENAVIASHNSFTDRKTTSRLHIRHNIGKHPNGICGLPTFLMSGPLVFALQPTIRIVRSTNEQSLMNGF